MVYQDNKCKSVGCFTAQSLEAFFQMQQLDDAKKLILIETEMEGQPLYMVVGSCTTLSQLKFTSYTNFYMLQASNERKAIPEGVHGGNHEAMDALKASTCQGIKQYIHSFKSMAIKLEVPRLISQRTLHQYPKRNGPA